MSGVGVFTKKGRCYPFYQDMNLCFNVTRYPDLECRAQIEDWLECLHHFKERTKLETVINHLREQQEEKRAQIAALEPVQISSSAQRLLSYTWEWLSCLWRNSKAV